jgi:hypothetical protein
MVVGDQWQRNLELEPSACDDATAYALNIIRHEAACFSTDRPLPQKFNGVMVGALLRTLLFLVPSRDDWGSLI